jgi:hypothetical protein
MTHHTRSTVLVCSTGISIPRTRTNGKAITRTRTNVGVHALRTVAQTRVILTLF